MRAFQALGRYQGGGKFRAWLYTIARNLCIDAARRPVPLVPEEERTAEEDGFARLEDEDAFLRRLQALPRPQQEALLLRFGHGLGFKEIGQITGVPPRTAQSRVRLGLTALKREWRD